MKLARWNKNITEGWKVNPENEKLVVCGNTSSKEEEHNQPAGVGQLGPQRRREISLANTVTSVSGRD